MARPFTYVSSNLYYDLEIYLFKLKEFRNHEEYDLLSQTDKVRIDREIIWFDSLLELMRAFRQIPNDERPVFAVKLPEDENETKEQHVYYFSSPIVAAKCLHLNSSHIILVCKKQRNSSGGYYFEYADGNTIGKKPNSYEK